MKHAVEIGSSTMLDTSGCRKTGSGIQKFMGGVYTNMVSYAYFCFFKTKKAGQRFVIERYFYVRLDQRLRVS
jgi:hypothetical protein